MGHYIIVCSATQQMMLHRFKIW